MASRLTDTSTPGSLPILNQALQDIANLKGRVATLEAAIPTIKTYTPSVTAATNSFTTTQSKGRYCLIGPYVFVEIVVKFITAGTGVYPIVSLPAASNGQFYCLSGSDIAGTGDTWTGEIPRTNNGLVVFRRADNTGTMSDGSILIASGFYEAL